uniref:40S ribosomal protein S3a n=1 Tax=Urocitellus parryii TaxID=9999 RepID=A0A8D2HDB2_UROPR
MAIINKLTKGDKKRAKKKVFDPYSKKDWYDVKTPGMFNIRNIGKTSVNRTQGTKIVSDGLKGQVFEVSPADLQNDEVAFRKFKLITEDVQGKNYLTNFHGMNFTRNKMCSMVKKWQTIIKAHVDVKTTKGYLLRLSCVGFTKNATINTEDFLHSAPADPPNPEDDDGNHDPGSADK